MKIYRNATYKQSFKEFLNLSNFSLSRENIGEKKWYADLYKQILKEITIPDTHLNKIYNSRYFKQFYSDSELNTFKKKWKNSEPISPNGYNRELNQAENEFNHGNIKKSIELHFNILRKTPDHPMALNNLGIIHWRSGDVKTARLYLNRAHQLKPSNEVILSNLKKSMI